MISIAGPYTLTDAMTVMIMQEPAHADSVATHGNRRPVVNGHKTL